MTNRRKFLGLFAATPIAAKQAADELVAKQAGIVNVSGVGSFGGVVVGSNPPIDAVATTSHQDRLFAASKYIKTFGVPSVIEFEARSNTKYVHGLDVDLAAKKSWSMAVKIQEQRQRNYEREIARYTVYPEHQAKKAALAKVMGFLWPF